MLGKRYFVYFSMRPPLQLNQKKHDHPYMGLYMLMDSVSKLKEIHFYILMRDYFIILMGLYMLIDSVSKLKEILLYVLMEDYIYLYACILVRVIEITFLLVCLVVLCFLSCGVRQSGDLDSSNKEALDGIIGFGKSNSSLISQLASSGRAKKMFAHCLDGENGGGIFAIGHVVQPEVNVTPLIPNQ